MTNNWEDFPNQSMGVTEIDGMNEKDEMELTDVREDILFSYPKYLREILTYFRIVWMSWDLRLKKSRIFTKWSRQSCILAP